MSAPIPNLSPLQRDVVRYAGDEWTRSKVEARVLNRLLELGLIVRKRERRAAGRGVMQTLIRRTARGREAIGLPPLETNGET